MPKPGMEVVRMKMIAAVYLRMKEARPDSKKKTGHTHETKLTLLAGCAPSGYLGRGATRAGRRQQHTGRGKGRRQRCGQNEETMVVTAARQTLQAPAFQRSRLTKYANTRRHRDISEPILCNFSWGEPTGNPDQRPARE